MKKNILKTVAVGMAACALVACSNGTNNAGAREETTAAAAADGHADADGTAADAAGADAAAAEWQAGHADRTGRHPESAAGRCA